MAVIQANKVLEDQSQLESGCLSSVGCGPRGTFVGIYDGHAAPKLREYTSETQEMSVDVVRKAFLATEEEFLSLVESQWLRSPGVACVGSCCLVGIICNGMLYVANAGDSRAVLARDEKTSNTLKPAQRYPNQECGHCGSFARGGSILGLAVLGLKSHFPCKTGDFSKQVLFFSFARGGSILGLAVLGLKSHFPCKTGDFSKFESVIIGFWETSAGNANEEDVSISGPLLYFLIMDEKNNTLIKDLDIQKDDFTVNVRIIRLWNQSLFKNPEQIFFIEMILMDEEAKSLIILGTVKTFSKDIPWFYIGCKRCSRKVRPTYIVTNKNDGSGQVEETEKFECDSDKCKGQDTVVLPKIPMGLLHLQKQESYCFNISPTGMRNGVPKMMRVGCLLSPEMEIVGGDGRFRRKLVVGKKGTPTAKGNHE
ncbi:hypothetical protein L6452_21983 [Arctium lappa]|uniref:Uncharacterized protein n=1 Tax=Arctium lappa TaxID=4217 RepID=A0ACB9AYX4_ARCLA|nr:hypothetical protein L6452_21983 [Arctium lappa]